MYDPAEALEHRAQANPDADRAVLQTLQELLAFSNPYVEKYFHLQEVLEAAERDAAAEGTVVPELSIRFSNPRHADPRTYNRPTTAEVAVVFVSEDGMPPANRDIVQHPRDGPLRHVSEMNCHLDPMSYPLLYWNPDCQGMGWHPASPSSSTTRST